MLCQRCDIMRFRVGQVSSRMVALEILTAHMEGALHEAQSLLPMALDPRCPSLVRAQALRGLNPRSQLDSISLRSLLDLISDPSEEIALSALDAVERHGAAIVPTAAVERLLRLLLSSKGVVRRRAIELLGTFGEVDLIERLCSLPVMEPADIDAIQRMVKRILTRPRSLLHISPHSFEHLISRMLAELQFVEVTVTGGVHDDGVRRPQSGRNRRTDCAKSEDSTSSSASGTETTSDRAWWRSSSLR